MDPVRTEVMKNRFTAIAEEASNVAYRTAYTTFVKQTQDYQVALANFDGEFFAYPMRSGVTSSGPRSSFNTSATMAVVLPVPAPASMTLLRRGAALRFSTPLNENACCSAVTAIASARFSTAMRSTP